jgi:Disulphide bond corrector protein DsbC
MKIFTFLTLLLVSALPVLSQQDPVQWKFSTKKLDAKTYEIHMEATVASPWHIYSQTTPDGGPLPTKIEFTKNPLVVLSGKTVEKGVMKEKFEEVFGVKVKYFPGSVEFVQIVKVKSDKAKTNLLGNIEFLACNDVRCMPPKTIPFSIALN